MAGFALERKSARHKQANLAAPTDLLSARSGRHLPVSNCRISRRSGIWPSLLEIVFDIRLSRSPSPPKHDRAFRFPSAFPLVLLGFDLFAMAVSRDSAAGREGRTPTLQSLRSC